MPNETLFYRKARQVSDFRHSGAVAPRF